MVDAANCTLPPVALGLGSCPRPLKRIQHARDGYSDESAAASDCRWDNCDYTCPGNCHAHNNNSDDDDGDLEASKQPQVTLQSNLGGYDSAQYRPPYSDRLRMLWRSSN